MLIRIRILRKTFRKTSACFSTQRLGWFKTQYLYKLCFGKQWRTRERHVIRDIHHICITNKNTLHTPPPISTGTAQKRRFQISEKKE